MSRYDDKVSMKNIKIISLTSFLLAAGCSYKSPKPIEKEKAPVTNAVTPPAVVPVVPPVVPATTCPSQFVLVPGNPTLGTTDFCVAKFHTKNFGGMPVVTPNLIPWDNINATDAMAKCESITEATYTGKFTLISNPEWMTIARNVELVGENWTGGSTGSGHIFKGHSDGVPDNTLAVTDETDFYNGTLNSAADVAGAGQEQKRVLKLSNGNVIWDLSGNIWSWVDWSMSDVAFSLAPLDASSANREVTMLDGSITNNDLSPLGAYTSLQSMGQWVGAGGYGGAVIRGGRWGNNALAGPFAMYMANATTEASTHNGFRCVYRF